MSEEVFYRTQELARLQRQLPGATYNLVRRLFRRMAGDGVFVPIRTMQYLAVVDDDEIIFVDGAGNRSIELAWQNFRPQARGTLTDPVVYEVVYYTSGAAQTMVRLQEEFRRSLVELDRRYAVAAVRRAQIIKLSR